MNELQSAIEAIIYAAEEPPTAAQLAAALAVERTHVDAAIEALTARYASDDYGVELRAVAGGFRMATKPQHHESVRQFLKHLKPPVRLSLAALETLAVIAYRQPITLPEIREIRGVDAAGVINTLLDKKLVTTAGRKEVIGKPILYRTTREFLLQFGLSGIKDLPTLKEFEEMAQAGLEGMEAAPTELAAVAAEAPATGRADKEEQAAAAGEATGVPAPPPAPPEPDPA